MRVEKITKIVKYLSFDELSKERQEEEYEKALKSEFFYDSFSFIQYEQYKMWLEDLQKRYNLEIEPIYTNGSQHGLLGFKSVDNKYNDLNIEYNGVEFYGEETNNDEYKMLLCYEEDYNEENFELGEKLTEKVNNFIKDFMKTYNKHFREYFMYGYCDDFEDFVKSELYENNDNEYEEIVSIKNEEI